MQGFGLRAALVLVALGMALGPGCFAIGSSEETPKSDAGTKKDTGTLGDGSWACTPKSCKEANADCGDTSDGCGDVIPCGTCPSGETCGAAGPNRCGVGTCTASTCASAGAECGLIGDGCGASLDCGTCAAPSSCGATGQANQCGCIPSTCADLGKNCGSVDDGCGDTLACGSCPTGEKCGAGGVPNVCACEPTTCAAKNATCGSIPDDCGGTLNCGSCSAPKTCGGLGTPNQCGCSPQDCPPIYQNSFEATNDFPTGWTAWHNCAADSAWQIERDVYPAPGGGSSNLRFHTTAFDTSTGCQYPGGYALSPKISALSGRVYRVETWSRNGSNVGGTNLMFFDAADQQVGGSSVTWTPDAWQYGADPVLVATSPAGTATLRVRLEMQTPSEYADIDLLKVYLEPP
jgi:hypothetical protein